MHRDEIIRDLSYKHNLTLKESKEIVTEIFDAITTGLRDHEDGTNIPGFGKFVVTTRKESKGVNPVTRQPMDIPVTQVIRFRPSSVLKEAVTKRS